MTVAIIEDDAAIRELVRCTVESAGYSAVSFCCAEDFLSAGGTDGCSLLLLDVMLPGMDGFTLMEQITAAVDCPPVIFLTAKTAELDKVKGLNMGAYDYISKPFGVLELIARVNAVLRRAPAHEARVIKTGALTIDNERHQVSVNGSVIELTNKEYELLYRLMSNVGAVLTREALLEKVWGISAPIESRTLDMHIRTLRQKLGAAGDYIKTIRGVGYSLRPEDGA